MDSRSSTDLLAFFSKSAGADELPKLPATPDYSQHEIVELINSFKSCRSPSANAITQILESTHHVALTTNVDSKKSSRPEAFLQAVKDKWAIYNSTKEIQLYVKGYLTNFMENLIEQNPKHPLIDSLKDTLSTLSSSARQINPS